MSDSIAGNVPGGKTTLAGNLSTWRELLGIPVALALAAAIWFMPTPAGLSVVGQKALALFAGVFILYLTEAVPLAITSLAIVPAAVILNISTVKTALDGFAASSVYLIVGAFILAVAMVKTRLAERITYLILIKIGVNAANITVGVTLANIILAFLVPSSTARTAILLPVCLSIIGLYKSEGRSSFAVGLLLILALTNATIGAGIMTATVPNPVTIDLIVKAGGPSITYLQWLVYGFPPALLMTFFTWWYVTRVFRPEKKEVPGGEEHVRAQLKSMGPMTNAEKRALAVFLVTVILWATSGWTKLDATVVCLLTLTFLFLPKFGVINWNDASKGVSWQVALVTGGGISLGDILMKTGAAKWLSETIFHVMGLGTASTLVILLTIIVCLQFLHILFVGTTPMATALMPIVLSMAQTANLNPLILGLPAGMVIGGYPVLMFYNTLPNILVYGTGRLKVGDFPRIGLLIAFVACGVYALCAFTYWRWLGLY